MRGPLDGVRVIDLTTVMFGPYCTQILGEMGADVVKVEPPGGDITRWIGPNRHPGMSAAHLVKGRNKRSIVIDLAKPSGKKVLDRLVKTADVFVHNMRPQAAAKLGIAYADLVGLNEKLVYCNCVGFGREGPYAKKPAYDDLIQGASGLAGLSGMVTGEPRFAPSVVADKTSGLFALYSITMALFHRERTGEGQEVIVPMFEAFTSFVMQEHLQRRTFEPPQGPAGYVRLLTPNRRPYKTKDGYVCVLPYNDRHWRSFFELAGRPELAQDPRFVTVSERTKNIDTLYGYVAEVLLTRTTAEWLAAFATADIASMPMYYPDDLFEDPHLKAVNMFPVEEHPSEGMIRTFKVPVSFSKTPGGSYRPAPRLGENTVELLVEAGYSEAEIAALLAEGATTAEAEEASAAAE